MRFTFIALFLITVLSAKGQDVHLSMYDMSPLMLNPSETGAHNGDWRAAVNFREQWKSIAKPFRTIAAGYDQPIDLLPGNFSAGAFIYNDRSGAIGLSRTGFYLSMAYAANFNDWLLSGGLQLGYNIKSYNLDGTTFPEQFNDNIGAFDPSLPLSEQRLGAQTSYLDINLGIKVQKQFENALFNMGFSALHLNAPNVSFFNDKDKLPVRPIGYANLKYDFGKNLYARPSLMMSNHGKAQEMVMGADIGMYFTANKVSEVFFGMDMRSGFDRNGDAFILSCGFQYSDFQMGLAYDINYSNLNQATNNRGAFEMSLIYISPSSAIKQITIPCDRY